jgi:glucosamine--fructose-6-phosphate aminotransferase (isomerizing)
MCGIVGFSGNLNTREILVDGLKELEYRGYDSSGIAILENSKFNHFKAVGKIKNLEYKIGDFNTNGFSLGIGHTRWATHGKPTELNAHPHLGEFSFVVHNGIIENYVELKKELQSDGVKFISQTDTEVIVHLFEKNYKKNTDSFKAFENTLKQLSGAYSILLITKNEPNKIFFAKNGSPLIIGQKDDNIFFSSSDSPLIGNVSEVVYLEDGDYGYTYKDIKLYRNNKEVEKTFAPLPENKLFAQKDGFRFFMEKEIYEQSRVVQDTITGRIKENRIYFDEIDDEVLENISNITICACGTSYHSALTSSYMFERISKIKTNIEIASEFRYKEPLLEKNTLFIVISQSGETADTLEALKMAKSSGLKTLAICNVDNSSIVRLSDYTILTRAGVEKGVASTKAFATQTMVLWMLVIYFAQIKKTMELDNIRKEIEVIRTIPSILKVSDSIHEKTKRLSKRYLHGHGFFFIGRDIFYPLALEGALKLKEISYLHAEGYPSGEMKHGPIALADSELFTIALMPQNSLYEKTKSNVEELGARDSTICAISPKYFDLADDFIKTNDFSHQMQEYFEMMIVLQLLSMEISIRLGNDVDMPRNLAKSVTVE